jgi:hypothetical protein
MAQVPDQGRGVAAWLRPWTAGNSEALRAGGADSTGSGWLKASPRVTKLATTTSEGPPITSQTMGRRHQGVESFRSGAGAGASWGGKGMAESFQERRRSEAR